MSNAPFIDHGGVAVFTCIDNPALGEPSPVWFSLSGEGQEVGAGPLQFSIAFLPFRFFDGSGSKHTMATPVAERLASAKTAIIAAIDAGFDLKSICDMGENSLRAKDFHAFTPGQLENIKAKGDAAVRGMIQRTIRDRPKPDSEK